MFRENNDHDKISLFDTSSVMNNRVKKKLDSSWAPVFYETVFKKVDETPFSVLYHDLGRSNFPINYSLSLEYIKYMRTVNDLI